MPATSNDVANEAILIAADDQPPVTGQFPGFDNSTAGIALQKLYGPTVRTVQRQWGWDASRNTVLLSLSGNAALLGYLYEYLYPSNGIQVWQLMPQTLADANNPLPQNWDVGNNLVGVVTTKVIWSNLQNAMATYNNNPSEAVWDSLFRESVVRLLASNLAIAIGGRPDLAQAGLETSGAFESIGEGRAD